MTAAPDAPQSAVQAAPALGSVCVYCASSDTANPAYLAAARQFGAILAASGVRLIYGGGGVGLMGACARGAHENGGAVLGVMPAFLQDRERVYAAVETLIVDSMHTRKAIMFERSDAFAVLPGGIGTLEEVVELMSWRRLGLHNKPIVFLSPDGFWNPLFRLIDHTIAQNLTPGWFSETWRSVRTPEEILPAMQAMLDCSPQTEPQSLSAT
jgi:uncharacterized protein (TIGR00730 family)